MSERNPSSDEPAGAAPETVDVVCALEHGLVITLTERKPVYSRDDDTMKTGASDDEVFTLAGGGAKTTLPANLARAWFADHADFDPVVNGLVYIAE